MELVREAVREEDWDFFNSLNIRFEGKDITAHDYSKWVIDEERQIIFTTVCWAGRDHGETYILIWGKSQVCICVESRTILSESGEKETYFLDIINITAPFSLKDKRDELLSLIRALVDVNYTRRGDSNLAINISEPKFVDEV